MNITSLPDHARVWIYQASRELSEQEVKLVEEQGQSFIENWSAHGASLLAAIEVKYNRFVVLAVDEEIAQASGCSIDKSVHFFQTLGNHMNVDFFNRLNLAYRDQNATIQTIPMADFQDKLSKGMFNADTQVFNNLVKNVAEYLKSWEVPVKDSWHKQMLPTA